jgi:hypothetical protein
MCRPICPWQRFARDEDTGITPIFFGDVTMKLVSLVTCTAVLAVCADAALAGPTPTHNPRHYNNRLARSIAMNEPAQPVAYAKLDAYLKASPSERAHGAWGLDNSTQAAPGASAGSER